MSSMDMLASLQVKAKRANGWHTGWQKPQRMNKGTDSLLYKGLEESLSHSDRDVVFYQILIVGKNDSIPHFPTIRGTRDETRARQNTILSWSSHLQQI